ncbi:MAG: hypothetical protein FWD93_00840 [Coriobacteriia bacterium]|nr:hypothetical protein [Coriobacteriia bacterium]
MKKFVNRLTLALVLALVASLGAVGIAQATPDPTNVREAGIAITKNLDKPSGTGSLQALTFDFVLTQLEVVTATDPSNPNDVVGNTFAPMASPTVTLNQGTVANPFQVTYPAGYFGQRQVIMNLNTNTDPHGYINLAASPIAFPHAGVFHFLVQEMPNTNTIADPGSALSYATNAHVLSIVVRNDGNGNIFVAGALGTPATPPAGGTPGTPGTPGTDDRWVAEGKYEHLIPGTPANDGEPHTPGQPGTPDTIANASSIAFRNIFVREVRGDLSDPALAINKEIRDDSGLSDLTTRFSIVATLTVPQQIFDSSTTPPLVISLTGANAPVVVDANGNPVYDGATPPARIPVIVTGTGAPAIPAGPGGTPAAVPADPFIITTTLGDGESLAFPNLWAGTTFGATEILTTHPNWSGQASVNVGGAGTGVTYGNLAATASGQNVVVPQISAHFVSDLKGGDPLAFGNSIDFLNDYNYSALTGLWIGSMPIVVALLVATFFLAMMVASRSRQRIEQLPVAH